MLIAALTDKKSSHGDMKEKRRSKQWRLNYINNRKKEHIRLVISYIGIGAVVRADDEICVLRTIKICIRFLFVLSIVLMKFELLKISKVM